MSGLVYGGKFEQIVNEMLGTQNIAASAMKFKDLEKQYGTHSFGKFIKYFLPKPEELGNLDKGAGGISERCNAASPKSFAANPRSHRCPSC
jgi:hypothetical protein